MYGRAQLHGDRAAVIGSLDSSGTEQLHFENAEALVQSHLLKLLHGQRYARNGKCQWRSMKARKAQGEYHSVHSGKAAWLSNAKLSQRRAQSCSSVLPLCGLQLSGGIDVVDTSLRLFGLKHNHLMRMIVIDAGS